MPLPRRKQVDLATKLIVKLSKELFYGEVFLKYEHGNIVHIRQTLNVKVEDMERRLLDPEAPSTGEEESSASVTARNS